MYSLVLLPRFGSVALKLAFSSFTLHPFPKVSVLLGLACAGRVSGVRLVKQGRTRPAPMVEAVVSDLFQPDVAAPAGVTGDRAVAAAVRMVVLVLGESIAIPEACNLLASNGSFQDLREHVEEQAEEDHRKDEEHLTCARPGSSTAKIAAELSHKCNGMLERCFKHLP